MIKRGKDRENRKSRNKIGQVWVETVIYTLIAFIIIGLVLTVARPKIQCMQDTTLLQKSTEMLRDIDLKIRDMEVPGNTRVLDITIKKGTLKLDCVNEKIIFEMDSVCKYSEVGINVTDGDIIILTRKMTDYYPVTLTRDYSDKYNLGFNGQDIVKELTQASNPYKLKIINEGENGNQKVVLNMSLG